MKNLFPVMLLLLIIVACRKNEPDNVMPDPAPVQTDSSDSSKIVTYEYPGIYRVWTDCDVSYDSTRPAVMRATYYYPDSVTIDMNDLEPGIGTQTFPMNDSNVYYYKSYKTSYSYLFQPGDSLKMVHHRQHGMCLSGSEFWGTKQ